MKKILSLVLVLTLVVMIPALADGGNSNNLTNLALLTPSIYYSLDGNTWKDGSQRYSDRTAFQCAMALFPATPTTEYTGKQWQEIEATWMLVKIIVPAGQTGRIFTYGWQDTTVQEGGFILELQPGVYEIMIQNGEIVVWQNDQELQKAIDLGRIYQQIRDGNINVPRQLDLAGVSYGIPVPKDIRVGDKNVTGPKPILEITD